jgi:hypothetical protein
MDDVGVELEKNVEGVSLKMRCGALKIRLPPAVARRSRGATGMRGGTATVHRHRSRIGSFAEASFVSPGF